MNTPSRTYLCPGRYRYHEVNSVTQAPANGDTPSPGLCDYCRVHVTWVWLFRRYEITHSILEWP